MPSSGDGYCDIYSPNHDGEYDHTFDGNDDGFDGKGDASTGDQHAREVTGRRWRCMQDPTPIPGLVNVLNHVALFVHAYLMSK